MHKVLYPSLENGTPFYVLSRYAIHISYMASFAKHLTSTFFVSRRQLYRHIGPTNARPILRALLACHAMNGSLCLTITFVVPSCNGRSSQTKSIKFANPPIRGSSEATAYGGVSSPNDTSWLVWSVESHVFIVHIAVLISLIGPFDDFVF
jgi:hypothetical protein